MTDRRDRRTIDELKAKYGEHWGISQEKPRNTAAVKDRLMRRSHDLDHAAILAEYARLGLDPVHAGDMLVSPGLAQKLAVPR